MKKERRHLSDLYFDSAVPNDKNEKCQKCGKTPNYLKDGQCYYCFFGFTTDSTGEKEKGNENEEVL